MSPGIHSGILTIFLISNYFSKGIFKISPAFHSENSRGIFTGYLSDFLKRFLCTLVFFEVLFYRIHHDLLGKLPVILTKTPSGIYLIIPLGVLSIFSSIFLRISYANLHSKLFRISFMNVFIDFSVNSFKDPEFRSRSRNLYWKFSRIF